MAGHSQFKNIMYRKGAQDAKKAKIFAKISREITVAAKVGGEEVSSNPRLRTALAFAREQNMPKENVERAIAKAMSADENSAYEDIRYEGYGAGGVAVIVESLTDNRNRTAPEIRSIFAKYAGNLGETGSVTFLFNRVGQLVYQNINFDQAFNFAIETGADNVEEDEDFVKIDSSVELFSHVRDEFMKKFGDPIEASVVFVPMSYIHCIDETKKTVLKMISVLEDNDDVQKVYHNLEE